MFCDECGRNVPCGTGIRERKVMIHGTSNLVRYKASICGICGAEIFDEDVEDHIMALASDMYRRKKNMVAPETIKNYMRKHGLGAEEMAKRTNCAVGEIIAAGKGRLLDPKADVRIKKVISA